MSLVSSAQASAVQSPLSAIESPSISLPPEFLRLRFTDAHDCAQIAALFHGSRKQELDPNGKVRIRSADELEAPVSQGSAVIATEPNGKIRFFGMASDHFRYTGNAMVVTEIGGIMSDLRGYKLTQIASAMLALREAIRLRESYQCIKRLGIHALVARDNAPAQKIFGRDLAWTGIEEGGALFDAQGKYRCPQERASRLWYSFQAHALGSARELVIQTITRGALQSRDGKRIPLALDPRAHQLV